MTANRKANIDKTTGGMVNVSNSVCDIRACNRLGNLHHTDHGDYAL